MRRSLIIALLLASCLAILFGTQRFFATHLTRSIFNDVVPREQANDTTRPVAMDPLQMVYLTWAAGDALRHGHLLLEDTHQFASRVERFRPMVLDPLVYLGGLLTLVLPLALAHNLAQVILPTLLLALGIYGLLRALAITRPVASGVALLAPFIPYRLLNTAMGQHNAASVCLLPLFYFALVRALTAARPHRWFALTGLLLLAIGCSEEHLAVATVLFGWPFVVVHFVRYVQAATPASWWRLLGRWLASLCAQAWPLLPFVAALGIVAAVERDNLLHHSIVRHVYNYDVIKQYSVEFNDRYFRHTVGYHALLLPLACAGVYVILVDWRRRRPTLELANARAAFALMFVAAAVLSLGYVPVLVRTLHVDLYRFFFEHLPLFDMQRYPHRLSYTAYCGGFVTLACALDAAVARLTARRARLIAGAAVIVALGVAAVDWGTRAPPTAFYDIAGDPQPALHAAVRRSAGNQHIVLVLPAQNGSMWSDTRVLLTAIHTGARFFNGYWSYVPTIYWNLVGSLQRVAGNGKLPPELVPDLQRVGVELVLLDKRALAPSSVVELRRNPLLRLIYEDDAAAFFALDAR